MSTKQITILGISILLLLVVGVWWFFQRESANPQKEVSKNSKGPEQITSSAVPQTEDLASDDNVPRKFPPDIDPDLWWKHPIGFYGKVVDENNVPVSEADIKFLVNDESQEGTTEYHKTSDSQGLFSLTGIKGKGMSVFVTKEGYYQPRRGWGNFEYAGEDKPFVPDAGNPVVFHLKKKGEAAELVKIDKSFLTPKDGTPVEISLFTGKPVPSGKGHIKVECWTMDQNQKPHERRFYDWKCRVSVPGGGLIESTKEFDFEAPVDGYRSFDEINMPMSLGQGTWTDQVEKWYFLKLGDGNFARIRFKMMAYGTHGCHIESYLNPDKSRNLEYDKSKEIEVKVK